MNLSESFLQPERLWTLLIVPILVVLYIWALRRKNRSGMRFTNTAVLGRVVGEGSMLTVGVAAELFLFVLFWVLSALYVRRANTEFDALTEEIVKQASREIK